MNKAYLVSKIIAYTTDTMNKEFKLFNDEVSAKIYFYSLIDKYISAFMDYYECSKEELGLHLDMNYGNTLFTALSESGEVEIEIQLEEMEIF